METFGNKNSDVGCHNTQTRQEGRTMGGESACRQVQSLGPTWCKERNDSCGCPLTSTWHYGRQACVHATHACTHTHTPIKKFVFI